MGLPFQKHLEWLCLEELSEEAICDFYDDLQLPIPESEDIRNAQTKVEGLIIPPVVRKNIRKGIYKKEDNWAWEKLGYGDLHRWRYLQGKDDSWNTVGRILKHPVMRTAIDACTIARFTEDKLITMLSQVYRISLTEDSLRLYRRYFGNFEAFTRSDWRRYLARINEDNYVYSRIFTALTRPLDEVLHLCGLPSENQFSDFLKNVLATANYKFSYYARQNSPEADTEARRWAKVGIESGEKYEKFGAGDANDFAKLVQTEFEYVTPHMETLDGALAEQIRPQIAGKKPDEKPPEVTPQPIPENGESAQ